MSDQVKQYWSGEAKFPEPEVSFGEGFLYGLGETSIPALSRLIARPTFKVDPNYNVANYAAEVAPDLVKVYPYLFVFNRSKEETDWVITETRRYQRERQRFMNSGAAGTLGGFVGGLFDPLLLVPVAGELARGGQVARLAVEGAGLVASSQAIATASQPGKPPTDIASGAVFGALGGALVGSAGYLFGKHITRKALAGAEEVRRGPQRSVGAAESGPKDPGGVAHIGLLKGPVAKFLESTHPTLRVLSSPFRAAREIQGRLSTSNVLSEAAARGEAVAEGGTVENRMHVHYGVLAEAQEAHAKAYADYVLGREGKASSLRAGMANILAHTTRQGKLTYQQFNEAIADAVALGKHEIPEVQKAAEAYRKMFDEMGRRAAEQGLLPEELIGSQNKFGEFYISFMVSKKKVLTHPKEWFDVVGPVLATRAKSEYDKWASKVGRRVAALKTFADDLANPKELPKRIYALEQEAVQAKEALQQRFADFEAYTGYPLSEWALRNWQKLYLGKRSEKGLGAEQNALAWRATVSRMVHEIKRSEEYKLYKAKRRWLNTRLRKLREFAPSQAKRQKAARTIAEQEARMFRQIDQLLNKTTKYLAKENRRKAVMAQARKELEKLDAAGAVLGAEFAEALKRLKAASRLGDKNVFWRELHNTHRVLVETQAELAIKRGIRIGKAEEVLKSLDKRTLRRVDKLRDQLLKEANKLDAQEPPVQPVTKIDGTIDWDATGRQLAAAIREKIINKPTLRAPLFDELVQKERGAELERRLLAGLTFEQAKPFIETDIEKIARAYMRTIAPDIELQRAFGSLTLEPQFEKLQAEWRAMEQELNAKASRGLLSEEEHRLALAELKKEYDSARELISAQVERIRGNWGMPDNPEAWPNRFGEFMLNWNVLRFLGRVVIPSANDTTKLVLRAGLLKAFGTTFRLYLGDLKKIRPKLHEAALAAGISDVYMATRVRALTAQLDDTAAGGNILQFSRWAAGKFIYSTGMPHVNQWMKELSTVISTLYFTQGIRQLAEHGVVDKKLQQLLANYGISRDYALRIWREIKNDKHTFWDEHGNAVPNVLTWTDQEAAHAFKQLLNGEANSLVVTPGLEKYLWTDKSMAGRLLYQFRGYAISSTARIWAAGLQQPDAALAETVFLSILAAIPSLWLRAQLIGGDLPKKMENWSTARWLDEAVDFAGIGGVTTEGVRLMQALGTVASLSYAMEGKKVKPGYLGQRNFVEVLAGPTASTLADAGLAFKQTLNTIAGAVPVRESLIHRWRSLMWLQNHFLLSRPFDMLEAQASRALHAEKRK